VLGRKRQVLVDTMGNLLRAEVHAADWSDTEGGIELLETIAGHFPRLGKLWADQGYKQSFVDWAEQHLGCAVEIVRKAEGQVGFAVEPRRWVVERTLAWENRCRRLSKDYEYWEENSAAYLYLASIQRLVKHAAASPL
jgi:putative transposase